MTTITPDVLLQRCLDACPLHQAEELERVHALADDEPVLRMGTWRKLPSGGWGVLTAWQPAVGETVMVLRKDSVVNQVVVEEVEEKQEGWLSRVHTYAYDLTQSITNNIIFRYCQY